MNTEIFKRRVALYSKKRALIEEVDAIEAEISILDNAILDIFLENEIDKITLADSGTTIFTKRDIRASIISGRVDDAVPYLEKLGLESLVKPTVNANSMASAVREIIHGEDDPRLSIIEEMKTMGILSVADRKIVQQRA